MPSEEHLDQFSVDSLGVDEDSVGTCNFCDPITLFVSISNEKLKYGIRDMCNSWGSALLKFRRRNCGGGLRAM